MRSMGRRLSEASPTSVKLPCCAASSPASMRMVEPELPQSSGAPAGWKLPAATLNRDARAVALHLRAQRRTHPRLLARSAPVEKF